ncbi:MAG: recombinase family protein, partial [Elusimicrobia bacterium]|nr:recombinase family protein [Elusimicrobiota bacterium]
EYFEPHNVSFISVTERFDTSTPAGRLLRNIMLTFGQFERELIAERIRDKIVQKVKRGLYIGGRPPLGYRAENARLVVEPEKAALVRKIFEMFAQDQQVFSILEMLKKNGFQTRNRRPYGDSLIRHLLRNPVLTGKIIHNGKVFPGVHEAIISEDLTYPCANPAERKYPAARTQLGEHALWWPDPVPGMWLQYERVLYSEKQEPQGEEIFLLPVQ